MSPIQQMLLGVGAGATKTYVDDMFSTYLHKGTGSTQTINNGINLSGEGGMTWIKSRNWNRSHNIYDTVRGANKVIYAESSNAEVTKGPSNADSGIYQFNNNGFNIGAINGVGANNYNYSSWTFRKAPGFFDVVTYTGTGSARTVDHNLGCVPGMIIIKRLDTADNWNVYHRNQHSSNSAGYYLQLNTTDSIGGASNRWNNTAPTATQFTVGTAPVVNASGDEFIAYVFAGGESTAATARSVEFDGNSDYLSLESNSDLAFGTGDFTIEFWVKMSTVQYTIFFDMRPNPEATQGVYPLIYLHSGTSLRYFTSGDRITGPGLEAGQWYHIAVSRSGTSTRMFLNGIQQGSTYSDSNNYLNGDTTIGCRSDGSTGDLDGYMSNVRVVKGTALYTSSFRPPYEPLTNITNTKLLCCNNSSVTGSTVTPGTITNNGDPTASTDSPFDDPAAFVFGENEDQNVIKCGSYVGDESDSNEVFLGFEPQWVMIKNASSGGNSWYMFDAIRGIPMDRYVLLQADKSDEEYDYAGAMINVTPTGFKVVYTSSDVNGNGDTLVYIAIRRPDGYVGKPPILGTGVFAMDVGNTDANIPNYDSTFPVDFTLMRELAASCDWRAGSRLIGTKYLKTNADSTETNNNDHTWDSNVGINKNFFPDTWQAWMWKRHAGMDVVAWSGTNSSVVRRHNLGRTPEMIWFKSRSSTRNWRVYHKGLNGGTNPEDYALSLNSNSAEASNTNYMTSTAPTSTTFVAGNDDDTNGSGKTYIAMLFASVDGISKVGSFTGTANTQTITTGFQPRFVIIKGTNNSTYWLVLDTVRGWSSGSNDNYLKLNSSDAQASYWWGYPTSTGFVLDTTISGINGSGDKCIYYAHA